MSWDVALVMLKVSAALGFVGGWLWYYRKFMGHLYHFAIEYPGLILILVLLYLLIYAQLGTGLGLPYLIWHEDFLDRVISALGATLLLGVLGVIAYYLDPFPWQTDQETAEWLKADEYLRRRVVAWWERVLWGTGARPPAIQPPPGWAEVLAFGANALLDPSSVLPFQGWLSRLQPNGLRLQRFLRAARVPFLLLLLAPAALPWCFPDVPRFAPSGLSLLGRSWAVRDVSGDGYGLGLGAWMMGIGIGVFLMKFFIRCSSLFYPGEPRDEAPISAGRPSAPWITRDSGCPNLHARCSVRLLNWPRHEDELPPAEPNLMVVAAVGPVLHFRVFDAEGRRVVDTDEARLPLQAERIGALKARLEGLWYRWEASLSRLETGRIVNDVASITGYVPGAGVCAGAGCPRGERGTRDDPSEGCAAPRQLRFSAGVFTLIFLVVYLAMGQYRSLLEGSGANILSRALRAGSPGWLRRFNITPAFSMFAALGILAMAYAVISYVPRHVRLPAVLGLVAWLGLANNGRFKADFGNMDYSEARLVQLRPRVDRAYFDDGAARRGDHAGLVPNLTALRGWQARVARRDPDVVDGRPKLVLVAVSGGASRSAYWTAVVLDRLEGALGTFGDRVRVIAGASGGMLGTACYVTYRRDLAAGVQRWRQGAAEPSRDLGRARAYPEWIRRLPYRSMDPLARYIALSEIWKSLYPGAQREDRGKVLEQDWGPPPGAARGRRARGDLRYPLKDLAPFEAAGAIPSLIFSPMMVEDGRRLLISNLDLYLDDNDEPLMAGLDRLLAAMLAGAVPPAGPPTRVLPMLLTRGRQIAYEPVQRADGIGDHSQSLSGIEYFRIFDNDRGLHLATAVRMSASFPYVSPAVNLPSEPPRRVVDAGYYDNYGIQVATSWIRQNRDWLVENTSGVLLVQIRDSSSAKDRLDVDDAGPTFWGVAARGFQFLTSPIEGVSEARYTSASFRNDIEVQALDSGLAASIRDQFADPDAFFATAIFENSADVEINPADFWDELTRLKESDDAGRDSPRRDEAREVAMSWYLTRAERVATERAIPDDPPAAPGRPGFNWADADDRQAMANRLIGQVYTDPPDLAPGVPVFGANQERELRRRGDLCFPPGPERAYRLKRLEQLRNYEQVQNLKKWWGNAGRRKWPAPG